MAETVAVELIAVVKRYGGVTAVDGIALKIPARTYCCLLGPSGCGKTTTLRLIAGHERLSGGDILIGDTVVNDLPPARLRTAMMFQNYALFPHLSCVDNVAFSLKMRHVAKPERRAKAMALLELVADGRLRRAPPGPALRRPAATRGPCPRSGHQGKPAAKPVVSPTGEKIAEAGEVRDGGSYWERMSHIAVWNTVMDEDRYMVRRWNEFIAA